LQKKKLDSNIKFPVWLNADILRGPLGFDPIFDAKDFVKKSLMIFPNPVISVGWTLGTVQLPYSIEMIEEAIALVKQFDKSVMFTFAVQVGMSRKSIKTLSYLLNSLPDSTLTIWGGIREDPRFTIDYFQKRFGNLRNRVFFDFNMIKEE